jgi:hypothetical protein
MIHKLSHIARGARLAGLSWALAWMLATPAAAAALNFTVDASEPVVVTGTPRLAIDVGGVTRYATYASGTGSSALTFSYAVQAGDFDANGITIVTPLDLNGGTLTDLAGNPSTGLNFTVPDTSALKVQTYTTSFTTIPITNANASAVSFSIAKAPTGASFSYAITSSGGSGSVTGSGTIGGLSHTVSGVDVSSLATGILTLSVTVSTAAGGAGAAKTTTATPTFSGILDGWSAGTATYSTRRMRSAYAGPLMRVRRSSDNGERDINATLAGTLDTATLSAFCGSASCFVHTWHDQSGNGRDASQANTAIQPRIVNAGTIDSFNGLPAPFFNGTDSILTTSGLLPNGNTAWSSYLVNVIGNGPGLGGRVWGMANNPSMVATLSTNDFWGRTGAALSASGSTSPRIVSVAIAVTTSTDIWVNGILGATRVEATGRIGNDTFVVGNLGTIQRSFHGYIHTLYFGMGTYPTANRQAVERWLGTLSGISVP